MPVRYYLCSYEASETPAGRPARRPAICRYLPVSDGPAGRWEEAEIRGNRLLVKVDATLGVHVTLSADPDFTDVPSGVVPLARRPAIRDRLLSLGYDLTELNGTGWDSAALFRLITSQVSRVTYAGGVFTVHPEYRPAPKRFADIERRMPG